MKKMNQPTRKAKVRPMMNDISSSVSSAVWLLSAIVGNAFFCRVE